MSKVLGIRQISVNPFEKFLQHKQSEQAQILENLYLDIEEDIKESRYMAEKVRYELLRHIPKFIQRLDNIFLKPKNFKAFVENKMDYPDESNQVTPLKNKPDYLQEIGSDQRAILIKVTDVDLDKFRQTKQKKRVFSFYLAITPPSSFFGQGVGETHLAYANNFDKILVFTFPYSDFADYKKMDATEKHKLVEGLISSYRFVKTLTHELRHALDESIDKSNLLIKMKNRNSIAQDYTQAVEKAYPKFLSENNIISKGLSNIFDNPTQYVRADIELLLQATPDLKKTLIADTQENIYKDYQNEYPQAYASYEKVLSKMQAYPRICYEVLEHFAKGTEDSLIDKYKIDLNQPNTILQNLCGLQLFLFLKTLTHNLQRFLQGVHTLSIDYESNIEGNVQTFSELFSHFRSRIPSMINEQEIQTYRVDSINEIMIASCLGLNADDIAHLLGSQQTFNALLFTKFEIFESENDKVDASASDSCTIPKAVAESTLDFRNQLDPHIIQIVDQAQIDWRDPNYKDASLELLTVFIETHTESESDIPAQEIIDFVQFLESNRKENGIHEERKIKSLCNTILRLLILQSVFISSASKIIRTFNYSTLYESLMERPNMDANVKFFKQFIKNVHHLKSLILEDLSFAKHNTMLLRPFIKTVADEERSLIVSLIDRSKLENIYEKVQIPTTDSIGKEFSAEMIEQFKHRTEKLANYNEKFLNVMDQIIEITRNECLMVCRQKNKMQERIDKILEFFDMVTQEQIKLFSVFATQKKQASNESYLASHEFFLQFSTPLYHMLTANIFNSSKQSPFSDYIHKKYSRDKINKPIDAEKFISLKSFTQYLASHFCMMLAYRLTYVENALSFGAMFSIFDSDTFYAYCWDSEDYNISTFEVDARKLEDTIESMVSVIEMASDVSLEDRMIQIIIIASFLKLLRSFE